MDLKLCEVDEEVLKSVVTNLDYPSLKEFTDQVTSLKEWVKSQHFPAVMEDKQIQNFLILNKGRVEQTKQKIENYYSVRNSVSDIYDGINPKLPYMENVLNAFYFVVLPKLTKDLYRVFFYKTRNKSGLSFFNPVLGVRYVVSVQEIRLLEDVMYGDVFILDGKDIPFSAFFYLTPSMIRKALVTIYKNVFSNRVKGIYILNAPFFIDKFIFLLKTVLKPKLIERIHIVKSQEDLLEKFGKEVIPRDYGGDGDTLENLQAVIKRKFQEYESYFDKLDQLLLDEKLRKPPKKT